MDRDRIVTLATKVLAGLLFVLSAVGLLVAVRDGEGIVTAAFGVYLTGLLVVGVFREATNDRNWQLAFFGGVAVWGGWEYAVNGDVLSLVLAGLGVVMVAANLLELR